MIHITRFNFIIADDELKAFQDVAKSEGKTASSLLKEMITERLKGDLRKRIEDLEKRVSILEKLEKEKQ